MLQNATVDGTGPRMTVFIENLVFIEKAREFASKPPRARAVFIAAVRFL
jgi:hypothetical protein